MPLPESAVPPGANGGGWLENMTGTLWADKVLPGHRMKASTRGRKKKTEREREGRTWTDMESKQTHKQTDKDIHPQESLHRHPHTDKKTQRKQKSEILKL